MDLFNLYATISLDPGEFERGLDSAAKKFKAFSDNIKSLSEKVDKVYSGVGDLLSPVAKGFEFTESVGKKAGSTIISVMKGLGAASTAAAGGAVAVGKSAFDAYANYEQLVGGVETLFKDSAWEVMGYAQTAYKTAGMSANQYMDLTTSFVASLLQSLDGDTSAAAKMADMAATDMADNWNKMGSEMRSVQDAYKGFAKQNYTMLDNLKLGYGGTKEEMKRLLADAEKFSGIKYDLSSYADIISAIHVIQTEMGITGTTALEASTTIQGSVQSMKGAWENFMVGIADRSLEIGDLMDNLVDSVVTAGNNIVPRIKVIVDRAVQIGPDLLRGFSEIIPEFARMGGEIIKTLADGVSAHVPALLEFGSKTVGAIADGIAKNAYKVAGGITGFISGIATIIGSNSEKLVGAGYAIINTILRVFNASGYQISKYIGDFIPLIAYAFIEQHEALFRVGMEILSGIGKGIADNKEEIGEVATEAVASMVIALRDNAPAIIEGGIALLEALAGAIVENLPLIMETGAAIIGELVAGISTASPAVQAIIGAAVLPHILKIIEVVGDIGGVVGEVGKFVKEHIDSIMEIGGKLMTGIKGLFTLLMNHPVIAIVTAIIAAVVLLWNNCEEFRNAVGAIWDAIVGFFQAAAEGIKAAFDGVVDFFAGVWQGIQDIFSTVVEVLGGLFDAAASAVQAAWNAVVSFFQSVWDGIQSIFSTVAEVLGGFFDAAASAVQTAWEVIVTFFQGVWDGIQSVFEVVADVLGGFFEAAAQAVQAAWEAVVDFFSGVWEGIQGVFSTVADVLGGFFKAAWEVVKGAWEAAKEFFGGIADGIHSAFETVTQFLGDAFSAAWEVIDGIWGAAVEFFSGIWDGITGIFGTVAEWFGGLFTDAWNAVTSAWDGVTEFFSGIWDSITGVFENALDAFKTIGGNILEGLWNGIGDKIAWLKSKVSGVVDTIKGWFTGKDGFDEHSPSKWSNQVFRYVMEGGVNGLNAGSSSLLREVDSIVGKVKSGMDFGMANIGLTANGSPYAASAYSQNAQQKLTPGMGAGNTFNFTFNSPKALDPVSAAREAKKAAQQLTLRYV